MQTALVGYTGFVGGNLAASHHFSALYNSKNIEQAFGTKPDLLVYSGVRAEKFLANKNPEADRALCEQALDNIRRIAPRQLLLISTVDVYGAPGGVDENTPIETEGLHPYGANRFWLERQAARAVLTAVVRLPALFGTGLKKNFLFDALILTPSMLPPEKYAELAAKSELVRACYTEADNGFFAKNALAEQKKGELRSFFQANGWNALAFTDSRSSYQFYPLARLWQDIQTVLSAGIALCNLTAEPLSAAEVYRACMGGVFQNELPQGPVHYDIRSIHAGLFGGADGYCIPKGEVLSQLQRFCSGWQA